MSTRIASQESLRAFYKSPNPRSVAKEIVRLDRHCRRFVELSPFVVLGTSGAKGEDVSPRGGRPGFVRVLDDTHLAIPDFPGNNRLDSLENIIETGRVGLLFLVPGVDETLRVNGSAAIDVDPDLRALGTVDGKLPRAVILVVVEQAYLHCGKALMRSQLWSSSLQIDRSSLPSMGEMLKRSDRHGQTGRNPGGNAGPLPRDPLLRARPVAAASQPFCRLMR
jgi:PPOX class probable FMN-dependent enzyme